MEIVLKVASDRNPSPHDLLLEATRDHVSLRAYDAYGNLCIRGRNGKKYGFNHWTYKPIDEHTDEVTLYLTERR